MGDSDKMDRPKSAGDPPTDVPPRRLNVDPWISVYGTTAGITGIRITIEDELATHSYTVGHMSSVAPAACVTTGAVVEAQSSLSITSHQARLSVSSEGPYPREEGPSYSNNGRVVASEAHEALQTLSPPAGTELRMNGAGGGSRMDCMEPGGEDAEEFPEWMMAVLRQSEGPH